MTTEEINKVLKSKKIHPTPKFFLQHYSMALFLLIFPAAVFIMGDIDIFSTILSGFFLLPSSMIFLYYGPRQLRLKSIDGIFPTNADAYRCAFNLVKEFGWTIDEANGRNYFKAIHYSRFTTANSASGTALIVFIDNNSIYYTSLYYPTSQASWLYNRNDKNMKRFQQAILHKLAMAEPYPPVVYDS